MTSRRAAAANSLAKARPDVAATAYGWDPTTVSAKSSKKRDWLCPDCGNIWQASVAHRANDRGCPKCSKARAGALTAAKAASSNNLAENHPEVAKQAHGWDPTAVSAKSSKRRDWLCPDCGYVWKAAISSRASGSGCPACSGHRVVPGRNDLLSNCPEVAATAYGWDPSTVSTQTNRKLDWLCPDCGYIWAAAVSSRTRGVGCPACVNQVVVRGRNDLATRFPDLAQHAFGWDASTVVAGTSKKRDWLCPDCGHIWAASVYDRTCGVGCPACSGTVVVAGMNDLLTTHPALAAEADGWVPSTVSAGTHKKMDWLCPDCGYKWAASVNNRARGAGCPACARTGFDPTKPGFLYFLGRLVADTTPIANFGISNVLHYRAMEHRRTGGFVPEDHFRVLFCVDGRVVAELEKSIKRNLRVQGIPVLAERDDIIGLSTPREEFVADITDSFGAPLKFGDVEGLLSVLGLALPPGVQVLSWGEAVDRSKALKGRKAYEVEQPPT